jgi:predicted AAA+ superfamily ATPase
MKRQLLKRLDKWKASPTRKPLVLRGARQVGKTTLINDFGKSYKQYIYLNLEKEDHNAYFEKHSTVQTIIDSLFLKLELENDYENTLLFIDEIQENPKVIALLRYFYEELPTLHVISAGSLLEFAMSQVKSFPVGRVQFLFLHPLNFSEFLSAMQKSNALKALDQIPLSPSAYSTLLDYFHLYAIIGGMPEVVNRYLTETSFTELLEIYEGIWGAYRNDVKKYAKNQTEEKVIFHLMTAASNFLDERVTFQNFGNSGYKSREVAEAFRTLDEARIIQLIYPTTDVNFPIKTDLNKKPRMQFLDTGLVNYSLKIQHELIGLKDFSDAFKGKLIPHLITQELISLNETSFHKPHFWVREKNQSSAEVDLVVNFKSMVIPIEIKSGKEGKLRSLHQFMEQCSHSFALRIYGGELNIIQTKTPSGKPFELLNLPYFLGTKIMEYVEWFVEGRK